MSLVTFSHFVLTYKLISGGGQLLGNDDGVKIPPGSGLPVYEIVTDFKRKLVFFLVLKERVYNCIDYT